MALPSGLQYKNKGDTKYGYSNGISSGEVASWTDVPASGHHTAKFYWDDKDGGVTRSRVTMTVTDEWESVVNADNSITITLYSSYDMVRSVKKTGACSTRAIGIFPSKTGTLLTKYTGEDISRSYSHSYDRKQRTITLQPGESTSVGTFYVVNLWQSGCGVSNACSGWNTTSASSWKCSNKEYMDVISAGTMFRNILSEPSDPPSAGLSCNAVPGTTQGTASISVSDMGCDSSDGDCVITKNLVWSTSSSYSPVVATGEGTKSLQPNTKYYLKATVSNGQASTTATCSFTTYATSYAYGYRWRTDQVSYISVQVNNGGDACDVTTRLYFREQGTSSWTLLTTTQSESGIVDFTLRELVRRGKVYEAYTETDNCAGTYTSGIYTFAPPSADAIWGVVTSSTAFLDNTGLLCDLEYCYTVTSSIMDGVDEEHPISSRLEYRMVGHENWVTLDDDYSIEATSTHCGVARGLQCGETYEIRSHQQVGGQDAYHPLYESYSSVVTVMMPICVDFNNCICDNLNYMTELICQSLKYLEHSDKTIYANCDTKELCDPYSNNPTIASILSRVVRYAQAVACLVCSMDDLSVGFLSGEINQYYSATTPGEQGHWVTLADEAKEGNQNLISSHGARSAVETLLGSVLRPIGRYNYYAEDVDDLEEQATSPFEGATAVIGDSYYRYDGTEWEIIDEVPYLQDLGLIVILDGEWAQHEFYWWGDGWNILDVTTAGDYDSRLTVLESANPVTSGDNDNYNIGLGTTRQTDAEILADNPSDGSRPTMVFIKDYGDEYFRLDRDALDDPQEVLA